MITQTLRNSEALLHEGTAGLEVARLLRDPVWRGDGVPHGDGGPVLLLPGFGMPDVGMRLMATWLRRINHVPRRAGLGGNVDCGHRAVQRLERRVSDLRADHGQRVALVGHSRGGALARALAARRPDMVSAVITLGTPEMTDTRSFHPMLGASISALAALGTLRAPAVLKRSCLDGECCAQFRAEVSRPLPDEVFSLGVIPARDRIVRHHRWLEQTGQRTVTVDATHGGVIANSEAFRAIAGGLHQARGVAA